VIPCIKRHEYRVVRWAEVPVIHIFLQVIRLILIRALSVHIDNVKTTCFVLDQLLTQI